MIPKDCKRLAEMDFPVAMISKHTVRRSLSIMETRQHCIFGRHGSLV